MDLVVVIAVLVVLVAEVLFVGRLLLVRGWWRVPEGRMMMTKDAAILLILTLSLVASFFPDWALRDELRRGVWVTVAIGFSWKTALLYRRQAEGRRLRGDGKHANGSSSS